MSKRPSKPSPKAVSARQSTGGKAGKPAPQGAQSSDLSALRVRIDRIDVRLVRLLNERARLVEQIGRSKRSYNIPIYAPHREAEVLNRALRANEGPLPDRTIEGIFREMMSGSFALEQPLRIGYLGPQGSYSHLAATKHFGSSVDYDDLRTITGVFEEVRRGHVDYGLVPIENSTGGGIFETLDAFLEHAQAVTVYAEVQLEVHHALLTNCEAKAVRRIHAKPEAAAQCRIWLATQMPQAEVVPAPSSSRAAMIALEEQRTAEGIGSAAASAAIGSTLAGQLYGLNVLFEGIEDKPNNVTRFFVICRQKAERTGDDKTSIMFKTLDKPGALVEALTVFARSGVNLTHIDKRPSGAVNWDYTFFVDAVGHREDPSVVGALRELASHCKEVTVLGSYPRSRRVL
ncbi:MAG: prephenate dehydratase [Phycisphaeraceae bacterium]|nr:prephenate dehydratase [Phycisphaeraceae bacterium]